MPGTIAQNELEIKLLHAAVADIGSCLVDLSVLLQQGLTVNNQLKRGGIAAGLERAAAHVRGKSFEPAVVRE